MRKLSLLSTMLVVGLVIGLVGSTVVIGEGATDTNNDQFELTRTGGGITLSVANNGGASDVTDFDPSKNYNSSSTAGVLASTDLEVFSTLNGNSTWTLSVDSVTVTDSPAGAIESTVTSNFDYVVDTGNLAGNLIPGTNNKTVSGGNGRSAITYNYTWNSISGDTLADVPDGKYEIKVEYTVSA